MSCSGQRHYFLQCQFVPVIISKNLQEKKITILCLNVGNIIPNKSVCFQNFSFSDLVLELNVVHMDHAEWGVW